MEFLVTMTTVVPDATPDDEVELIRIREAARSRELAAEGRLLRPWRTPVGPGEWRAPSDCSSNATPTRSKRR